MTTRLTDAEDTNPTSVYRLFDSADRLLYVGCSADPASRISAFHMNPYTSARSLELFGLIDHYTHIEYPDRATAREAERQAIAVEAPLFNKQHNAARGIGRTEYDRRYAIPPTAEELARKAELHRRYIGEKGRFNRAHVEALAKAEAS